MEKVSFLTSEKIFSVFPFLAEFLVRVEWFQACVPVGDGVMWPLCAASGSGFVPLSIFTAMAYPRHRIVQETHCSEYLCLGCSETCKVAHNSPQKYVGW